MIQRTMVAAALALLATMVLAPCPPGRAGRRPRDCSNNWYFIQGSGSYRISHCTNPYFVFISDTLGASAIWASIDSSADSPILYYDDAATVFTDKHPRR